MPQAVIWRGTTALVEQSSSPQWEFGEQIVATTIHKGPYALCLSTAPLRGTLGTGSFAGLKVDNSRVTPEKGGLATLTITFKGLFTDVTQVPADQYTLDPNEKEFAIETHPRYADIGQTVRALVRATIEGGSQKERDDAYAILYDGALIDPYYALGLELSDKLFAGETHFFFPAPIYNWTLYFVDQPSATLGGYFDTPGGTLIEPGGYDWLRLSDRLDYDGAFWKLTRRWQAALIWDSDLYA